MLDVSFFSGIDLFQQSELFYS